MYCKNLLLMSVCQYRNGTALFYVSHVFNTSNCIVGITVFHCNPSNALLHKKQKRINASACWRRGRDSNPRAIARKLISSQPRYDHFDTSPCMSNTLRPPKTSK